jgi:putative oxidoreductase
MLSTTRAVHDSLALLILRLGACGLLIFGHGWRKLESFQALAAKFPDPIGLGGATTLSLAIFAEVFCAAAVALGLLTRVTVIPILGTLAVAGFIHHAADPFPKKELAFLFLVAFLPLLVAGAGRYSLDTLLEERMKATSPEAKPARA